MSYQNPPTWVAANLVSAEQLNALTNDIEYLYGLVAGANVPVSMLKTRAGVDLDSTNNQFLIRHGAQYLHFRCELTTNDNNDLDIFIVRDSQEIMIWTDSTTRNANYIYEEYIDIEDVTTWTTGTSPGSGDADIYQGAWATSTGYSEYDIVLEAGTYYVCPSGEGHTSGTFATDLAAGKWVAIDTDANFFNDN